MPHIYLQYYNEQLKVGLADWKTVFLFEANGQEPIQLLPEFHRGQLVYRGCGKSKRISYRQIKKGLIKKVTNIFIPDFILPF
jgi:hypothetical protein